MSTKAASCVSPPSPVSHISSMIPGIRCVLSPSWYPSAQPVVWTYQPKGSWGTDLFSPLQFRSPYHGPLWWGGDLSHTGYKFFTLLNRFVQIRLRRDGCLQGFACLRKLGRKRGPLGWILPKRSSEGPVDWRPDIQGGKRIRHSMSKN